MEASSLIWRYETEAQRSSVAFQAFTVSQRQSWDSEPVLTPKLIFNLTYTLPAMEA